MTTVMPPASRPAVTDTTLRLYRSMGPWADADPDNGYLMLTWLASMADQIDSVVQVISDSELTDQATVTGPGVVTDSQLLTHRLPSTRIAPGWSAAVDINRCPPWALRWLGQFVGVHVPLGTDPDAARTMIRAEAGFGRGTLAAVQAAAAKFLRAGREILITERDGDAYSVGIGLDTRDLLSLTYAELSFGYATYPILEAAFATYDIFGSDINGAEAAILAAIPAGIVVHFTVDAIATYGFLTAHYDTYTTLAGDFATYDVMTSYVPEI